MGHRLSRAERDAAFEVLSEHKWDNSEAGPDGLQS